MFGEHAPPKTPENLGLQRWAIEPLLPMTFGLTSRSCPIPKECRMAAQAELLSLSQMLLTVRLQSEADSEFRPALILNSALAPQLLDERFGFSA
ncbi:MAG: hypothetical protein IPP41_11895 [Rhodocyclaceae bacterium]|nr:hypothetical protein [Rhodocyclaceae bacterium]